jgi:hypothetical protein
LETRDVDLRADVAVGARNPTKVVGVAQDSGGIGSRDPEGKPKSRGDRITSVMRSDLRKTARPWKRRGGSREPNSDYEGRESFEGQGNPMRVVEERRRSFQSNRFSKP